MADPSNPLGRFDLPFQEQIDFFRQKLNLGTAAWDDIRHAAHDRAFVVAGAMKADLLDDLRRAVDQAIATGTTLQSFRDDFRQIVFNRGWHGWTGEGTTGGFAWRTKVIYETNLRASYAAGREAQLADPGLQALLPYRRYVHNDSVLHPRPLHLAWNGLTLPHDHPFWKTHSPPNGWGCRCRVTAVAAPRKGDATAPPAGWDAIDGKTGAPAGIDKGWGYAPGASVRDELRALVEQKVAKLPPEIAGALKAEVAPVVGGVATPDNTAMTMAIPDTFDAPDFPEFSRGKIKGHRPIAIIPDDLKESLPAEVDVLLLSQYSAGKQYREHPDILPADYKRLQSMLDSGEVRRDRALHLGLVQDQGSWYYAVIKATATGKAVYLQSFRRTNPVDVENIRNRGVLVRAAK